MVRQNNIREKMTEENRKKQDILKAARKLSAQTAWESVSLVDIGREADVSATDITAIFPQKSDIVLALLQHIDDEIQREDFGFHHERDTAKDRLFEVIMFRFDLLEEDRASYISMLSSFQNAPEKAWRHKSAFLYSMRLLLEKSEINIDAVFKEDILMTGLALVYILSVKTWMKDDSPDLAKTMSTVDRHLTRMFSLSKRLDKFGWARKTVWSEE